MTEEKQPSRAMTLFGSKPKAEDEIRETALEIMSEDPIRSAEILDVAEAVEDRRLARRAESISASQTFFLRLVALIGLLWITVMAIEAGAGAGTIAAIMAGITAVTLAKQYKSSNNTEEDSPANDDKEDS